MGKKIKHIDDYLDRVHERFPEFSIEDLRKIATYGSNSLYHIVSKSGDIYLSSKIDGTIFKFLIGRINFQSIAHRVRYAISRAIVRFRYLYRKLNIEWDGYYYFGLTDERFNEIINSKGKYKYKTKESLVKVFNSSEIDFGGVLTHKILDECLLNIKYIHFFRIKFASPRSISSYLDSLKTNKAEYFLRRSFDGYEYMINENINNKLKEF